jgi:proline racemase
MQGVPLTFSHLITTFDAHTAGEPVRVVVAGLPYIRGDSMVEKKKYFIDNMDQTRRLLMLEPRGHSDMCGAVLTEPTMDDCDLGVIFLDSGGYLDMCVHGSIGVAKVAIETGLIKTTEPATLVNLDTPAGTVRAEAVVKGNHVGAITIRNVPSFLCRSDVNIESPEFGSVKVDIAFGGNFYAIVDAKELGTRVESKYADKLVSLGIAIRNTVNEKIKVEHPLEQHINRINLVEICDRPREPNSTYRNTVVFGAGQLDRSPCGTGTCAKMATLHAKGALRIGEQIVSESIIGTLFRGRIVGETRIGGFKAIIPEISGEAYLTGIHQFVMEPGDPLRDGFLV